MNQEDIIAHYKNWSLLFLDVVDSTMDGTDISQTVNQQKQYLFNHTSQLEDEKDLLSRMEESDVYKSTLAIAEFFEEKYMEMGFSSKTLESLNDYKKHRPSEDYWYMKSEAIQGPAYFKHFKKEFPNRRSLKEKIDKILY